MRRRTIKRGAAPDNGAAVERWEAPAPCLIGGGTPYLSVPDGPRRARPKGGPIIPPRRLPALHPLASRGKEKGEGRARVHKNGAGGALGDRLFASHSGDRHVSVISIHAPGHCRCAWS